MLDNIVLVLCPLFYVSSRNYYIITLSLMKKLSADPCFLMNLNGSSVFRFNKQRVTEETDANI